MTQARAVPDHCPLGRHVLTEDPDVCTSRGGKKKTKVQNKQQYKQAGTGPKVKRNHIPPHIMKHFTRKACRTSKDEVAGAVDLARGANSPCNAAADNGAVGRDRGRRAPGGGRGVARGRIEPPGLARGTRVKVRALATKQKRNGTVLDCA